MTDEHYDAIVIGTSQGGRFLPVELAKAGQRVALVERDQIGGVCVNTDCTPTKTMVASARLAHQARRGAEYGAAASARNESPAARLAIGGASRSIPVPDGAGARRGRSSRRTMVDIYRFGRRLGCSRRESLRLALLWARLCRNDPPTDVWGRPAAWARRPTVT